MEQDVIYNFIPFDEDIFSQGMPDFIGEDYAKPADYFWQSEIDYNGRNLNYE